MPFLSTPNKSAFFKINNSVIWAFGVCSENEKHEDSLGKDLSLKKRLSFCPGKYANIFSVPANQEALARAVFEREGERDLTLNSVLANHNKKPCSPSAIRIRICSINSVQAVFKFRTRLLLPAQVPIGNGAGYC